MSNNWAQDMVDSMKKWDQDIEKMQIENYKAQYKREKKEPFLRRKAILEEMYHKGFIEALWEDHEEFINKDGTVNVEKFDRYVEERLEEYDQYITKPINEYYGSKLKEIDELKLKVVRKGS